MSSAPGTSSRSTTDLSLVAPSCCGRPMSKVAVTEESSELAMLSCSSCSRHAWLRDGQVLDREGMLAAVKERLAEAPRPKGGRPRGSGSKRPVRRPAAAAPAPGEAEDAARRQRVEEMRAMLSGFQVLGADTDVRG